ncbi:MAG: phospholipid carrier-dependent glycosyltransferase [Opitutus sp.]
MRPRRWDFIGNWILFVACACFGWSIRTVDLPLDHDEIYWVGSAYYYDLAVNRLDWTNPAWRLLPARENPPVSKYVIGAGLAAAGYRITTIDSLSYFYLFWLQWENDSTTHSTGPDGEKRARVVDAAAPGFRQWVVENRRAPLTRPLIHAARSTLFLCVMMAGAGMVLLGQLGRGRLAGLFASALLLLHPAVVSAATHAMADGVALMFSMLSAAALFCWQRGLAVAPAPSGLRRMGFSVFVGVVLALACGAKMNSLVLVVLGAVMAGVGLYGAWKAQDRTRAKVIRVHFSLMLVAGLVLFVAINPAILQDPIGGLAATVSEHARTEKLQTDLAHPALVSISAKIKAVVSMAFFGLVPFAAMVGMVGWLVVKHGSVLAVRFAVCWWLVALVCVTWWIPFHWSRYIIPLLPPSAWLVAQALEGMVEELMKLIRKSEKRRRRARSGGPQSNSTSPGNEVIPLVCRSAMRRTRWGG